MKDLKEKGAKVILADFYEPAARHIMCQAYKLSMTQAEVSCDWWRAGELAT